MPIYHVAVLEIDSLVSDLEGCFDFSNSIEIIKGQPEGGTIIGVLLDSVVMIPALIRLRKGQLFFQITWEAIQYG